MASYFLFHFLHPDFFPQEKLMIKISLVIIYCLQKHKRTLIEEKVGRIEVCYI